MSEKKRSQLGMNPSTASGRLVKDLLWRFIQQAGQDTCCKCGDPMSRETFSIEHVVPWLDSEDPVSRYFDPENISYSHLLCNVSDIRANKKYETEEQRREAKNKAAREKRRYCSERRRAQYARTGN